MIDIHTLKEGENSPALRRELFKQMARYRTPGIWPATFQLINTIIPYVALWAAMIYLLKQGYSFWVISPLTVLAGMFLVRIFIFFHDCCHGSFFSSDKANTIVGYITGILTFTPFNNWQISHLLHHGTAGNLDKRGHGDMWTMTVNEYRSSSRFSRLRYRFYRHPLIFLIVGPLYTFLINHRFSVKEFKDKVQFSVIVTNIALLAIIGIASVTIGIKTYLLIQIPTILVAGALGIWLFYIQHQFQDVYWEYDSKWSSIKASLAGSSFYKLPAMLRWFSGNIGYHHIHHFDSRIPNYRLRQCYEEVAVFQAINPITIRESLKSAGLKLFDEDTKKMVGFDILKTRYSQPVVGV